MSHTETDLKSYEAPALEKRDKLADVAETITYVSGVQVLT